MTLYETALPAGSQAEQSCIAARRPVLLDLFACGGGAGRGYELAGFDVYAIRRGETMTAAASALVCSHISSAHCILCSDLVPWWKDARIRMGLGAEPPNPRPIDVSMIMACTSPECGRKVWAMGFCRPHYYQACNELVKRGYVRPSMASSGW